MSHYAPIALFVYNRVAHTRQTLAALKANIYASESELFIFSDAAKSDDHILAVEEVRAEIRNTNGFKTVHITEQAENLGLANSIISGVTELTSKYGRVIVLEDDLITSKYFLQFMNDALNHYSDHSQVMHISGYMFPIDSEGLPPSYFLRTASCWGWATWQRAWCHFEKSPNTLLANFDSPTIERFNMDGTYNFWKQVIMNKQKKINTWAVFWYASIFQRNGLCLHPAKSLVVNIGHDGSGVNCGKNNSFNSQLSDSPIIVSESPQTENKIALHRTKIFFNSIQYSLPSRIYRYVKNLLIRVQ